MAAGDHHHHHHVDAGSIETAFARPQARLVELATAAGGAAEGLDQASCGAKVKYLAEVAIGESMVGGTPQTWRARDGARASWSGGAARRGRGRSLHAQCRAVALELESD